jgi:hypothetical protein
MRRFWIGAIALVACVPASKEPKPKELAVPEDPADPYPDDPSTPCEERGPPVTPRLRRLTFAQYDRTVSDLIGFEVTPSAELGPEVDGVTSVVWAGVESAAAGIGEMLRADPVALAALLPCEPSGDGSACARDFVTSFGRRAFRRPLGELEIDRYLSLYTDRAELTENGTFEEGIALVVEAFLQSPYLLLRVETSATEKDGFILLSGYELASRLSYSLWNGPPDEALLLAAEDGELDTPEGIRREALRMLTGDDALRARTLMREAHREWLGMVGAYGHFWSNTQRDPELFPEFYPGIDVDFREEVLRFADRIVFDEDGGYRDLLTSPLSVVNARLAPIYGLEGDFTDEWVPVTLDPALRPGLLTRAGFLGTHGRFSRGSLIFRGAFVLRRLLCVEIGSPPPGAEGTPLPDATEELVTTRDRIQSMTSAPTCMGCHHQLINPAGFAFETFDGLGRHRTEDNGAPIDPSGSIYIEGIAQPYSDPASYGELLASSQAAAECYVDRFAELTFSDGSIDLGCAAEALAARLIEPDTSIKDFLVELVASDAFRHRSILEAP